MDRRQGGRHGTDPDSDEADEGLVELYVVAERTAARIVGAGPAEDIASETLIRALSKRSKVAPFPVQWATRVATNLAIDQLRKKRPTVVEVPVRSVEDDAVDRQLVISEVARLSRRQRQVVVLRYLVGLPEAETATVLGLSVETVKTHARQGLGVMRSHVRSDQEVCHGNRPAPRSR